MNYGKKLGPGIFLWKPATFYQFLGSLSSEKSVVNCSNRCKVPLACPGSSGFSAGESRAWLQLVSFTTRVTLRWVSVVGSSFILCHMCAFGKWMSIQNSMRLLIKSIKYQIKNILSLQRLNFESRSPSERLESNKLLFGPCL